MTTVTVREAQERLPELLAAVERGEEVRIARDGGAIALVLAPDSSNEPKAERPPVRFGAFAEGVAVLDPNWDAPMDTPELRETFGDEFIEKYGLDSPDA